MKKQKHKSFKRHVPIGRAMLQLMLFGLLLSGSLKSYGLDDFSLHRGIGRAHV